MASGSPAWTSAPRRLLLPGLLALGARAEPMLRVPDYVTDHAPMVWLHPEDPYMPSDLLEHIRHTTPVVDGNPIPDLPSLDLDNLDILNEYGDEVALTADESAVIEHPDWLLGEKPDADGRIHNATACAVILVEKDEAELDAFYFYFYSYDEGPNITQVLKPLDGLVSGERAATGIHFGNHIGDWEHTMVRFRDGEPVGIFYSQHAGGAAYEWDDPTLSITDGRPDVYSALGSHANFPTTGDQIHNVVLVDYCDKGPKWDPVLSAYFYHFDPDVFILTPLTPSNKTLPSAPAASNQTSPLPSPSSNLTSWFYFTGRWGDMEYPESDPRQESVPYFGLKRFKSGPTGPRHKPLVRKGLMPDNLRGPSWMERGVAVFMALYPFIFKGWRKWVLLGVVIVATSGIAIGIVYAVRRYKKRPYRKIQGDDVQLEDWGLGLEEEALLSGSDSDSEDDDEDKKGRKGQSE